MKEDFELIQLEQGHDRSLLGTNTTTSSIVILAVILTLFCCPFTFVHKQSRVGKGKLYFS